MLSFKPWLLTEEVKLIKNHLSTHDITYLGKISWWNIYSAVKSASPSGRILNLNNAPSNDYLADPDVVPLIEYEFQKAANKLASLGFSRMNSVVLIVDIDGVNSITGGGIGGEAYNKEHGFTVQRGHVHESTIIHEHAHMMWFNLPKVRKEFFEKYYKQVVMNMPHNHAEMWQSAGASFDISKINKVINECFSFFQDDLEDIVGMQLERYFDLINAKNDNEKIEIACLYRRGTSCYAVAKKQLDLYKVNGYDNKTIDPGEKVLVEKFDKYIIQFRPNNDFHERYELDGVDRKNLLKLVEFEWELLNSEQKDRVRGIGKLEKPTKFFAPHTKKEKIEEAFDKAAEEVAKRYTYSGGYSNYSTTFSKDQLFSSRGFYNSWMSRIGRRFKAGKIKDINGVKEAYLDVLKSKLNNNFHAEAPHNIYPGDIEKLGYDWTKIASPEGKPLRKLIAKKGLVPSDYAAANVDELWAVSVERAALGLNVSPDLKKLIYITIHGG